MNKTHLIYAGIFAGGAVVGGVATYFASRKYFDEHYSQLATDEIKSVKEHYHNKEQSLENEFRKDRYSEKLSTLGYHADTERPTPEQLAELDRVAEVMEKSQVEIDINPQEGATVAVKPYDSYSSDEDRDKQKPYLISQDEYSEEPSYAKISITFYQQDSVLADDRDYVIDDVDATVGEFRIDNFGKLSGDPNLMLIRNDRLMADYEIALDQRSFNEVVLGFTEG